MDVRADNKASPHLLAARVETLLIGITAGDKLYSNKMQK